MFGEVYDADPAVQASYVTTGQAAGDPRLPVPGRRPRLRVSGRFGAAPVRRCTRRTDYYTSADSNAYELPTFLGNHDMGRIGSFLTQDNPSASQADLLQRDLLANQLMFLTRGQPVVYYGDEQGFTGPGGDKDARQDMFPSQDRRLPRPTSRSARPAPTRPPSTIPRTRSTRR